MTAGELVAAARAADGGWDDPAVRAMMAEHASCRPRPAALRGALEAAAVANMDELLALDAEMRFVRPVHGLAIDAALCAAGEADQANTRFLRRSRPRRPRHRRPDRTDYGSSPGLATTDASSTAWN